MEADHPDKGTWMDSMLDGGHTGTLELGSWVWCQD